MTQNKKITKNEKPFSRVSPVQYSPRRQSRWVLADYGGRNIGAWSYSMLGAVPRSQNSMLNCASAGALNTRRVGKFAIFNRNRLYLNGIRGPWLLWITNSIGSVSVPIS